MLAYGQPRTEFVSFELREQAERDDRAHNKYVVELGMDGVFDVPVLWLDREFFVHAETDKGPVEWRIGVTDGQNKVELPEGTTRAWLYSQPKLRVADFVVDARVDSTLKFALLKLDIVVANGYNFAETVNVGYDIYSPQGKLLHFDNRDVTVDGQSTDTLHLEEYIYGMPANAWSAAKPNLHKAMIIVRYDKRITEYIPFKVGFLRQEPLPALKVIAWDKGADMKKLKAQGFNALLLDRPQPYTFYNKADEAGFYVFDQPVAVGDANDPKLIKEYLQRAENMFRRVRNHPSVAGWGLGAPHGNGYNMYKTYQLLKSLDPRRPVFYNGAEGQWNSDMNIEAVRPR